MNLLLDSWVDLKQGILHNAWWSICAAIIAGLACVAVVMRKVQNVNTPGPTEYPIIQGLPWVIRYASKSALDGILLGCQWFEWKTWTIKWPGHPRMTMVSAPENLEYILKTNFANYPKGPYVRSMLQDLLGEGIFAADGELWMTQRKVSVQMFSARQFSENIMRVLHKHAHSFCDILGNAADAGQTIDMHDLFHRFTLDSIGEIAFGTSVGSLQDPKVAFARAFDQAQSTVEHRAYLPGWQFLTYILPREYQLRSSVKVMDKYCYKIIKERRAAGDFETRCDVLSRFMSMKDEQGNYLYLDNDKFLRDVILNFMIAGRDTTAQALSWAVFRLAQNVEVIHHLREEGAAVFGRSHGVQDVEPVYETVSKALKVAVGVMLETLRLHPSVPKDIKQCLKDDVLPDGTHVPAGSYVVYLTHAMGRNPDIWGESAGTWNATRFMDCDKVNAFKYPAFNAGPRTCLGKHMALVESTYLLHVLFSNFDLSVVNPEAVEPADSLTLPMKAGLQVRVMRRHASRVLAAPV